MSVRRDIAALHGTLASPGIRPTRSCDAANASTL